MGLLYPVSLTPFCAPSRCKLESQPSLRFEGEPTRVGRFDVLTVLDLIHLNSSHAVTITKQDAKSNAKSHSMTSSLHHFLWNGCSKGGKTKNQKFNWESSFLTAFRLL